jgi:hypothetical protein
MTGEAGGCAWSTQTRGQSDALHEFDFRNIYKVNPCSFLLLILKPAWQEAADRRPPLVPACSRNLPDGHLNTWCVPREKPVQHLVACLKAS